MTGNVLDILDDLICGGVAIDVFQADQARRLLEELDLFVDAVNKTGLGMSFLGNLQLILERHLCLSLARLYEPYSSRNLGRSIAATTHSLRVHAPRLQIAQRSHILDFLIAQGRAVDSLAPLDDQALTLAFVDDYERILPKPDSDSARVLDQAVAKLKNVRDKAIAHHDRVNPASVVVPGWPNLVELIGFARQFVVLVARSFLNVSHDLERDANRPAQSLRRLLEAAGLAHGL